jgi:hypothetical protein
MGQGGSALPRDGRTGQYVSTASGNGWPTSAGKPVRLARPASSGTDGPLQRALERGRDTLRQDIELAGGLLSATDAEARLGAERLSGLLRERRVLWVRSDDSEGLPAAQLRDDDLLPGIDRVLGALDLADDRARLNWLVRRNARLGGESPLHALQECRIEAAVQAAELYGSHEAA